MLGAKKGSRGPEPGPTTLYRASGFKLKCRYLKKIKLKKDFKTRDWIKSKQFINIFFCKNISEGPILGPNRSGS